LFLTTIEYTTENAVHCLITD